MVYLTGDTHGQFDGVLEFCEDALTSEDDVLIILGDAGINYFGEPSDRELKEELRQLPITLFCLHGNHEMRPETIETYEETERFGGTVYWEPDFPRLLFAKDGEVYEFEGRRWGFGHLVEAIDCLTRRKDETYKEFIMRISEKWRSWNGLPARHLNRIL
jgi:3-oxoacid CoA-transferase subunit A